MNSQNKMELGDSYIVLSMLDSTNEKEVIKSRLQNFFDKYTKEVVLSTLTKASEAFSIATYGVFDYSILKSHLVIDRKI
jgi:hypothetical protein